MLPKSTFSVRVSTTNEAYQHDCARNECPSRMCPQRHEAYLYPQRMMLIGMIFPSLIASKFDPNMCTDPLGTRSLCQRLSAGFFGVKFLQLVRREIHSFTLASYLPGGSLLLSPLFLTCQAAHHPNLHCLHGYPTTLSCKSGLGQKLSDICSTTERILFEQSVAFVNRCYLHLSEFNQ